MDDPRLVIHATARPIPLDQDTESSLFSLVWNEIEKWSVATNEIKGQLTAAQRSKQKAWINLADTCFHLRSALSAQGLTATDLQDSMLAQVLLRSVRHIEQELELNNVVITAPVGVPYTLELADIIANVEQIVQPGIAQPVIHEILVPVVEQNNEIIRFGKAIIAVPVQS